MITHAEATALVEGPAAGLPELLARAGEVRDRGRGRVVTFSAKVFVPLTTLCRDYCGYCTFRRDPGEPGAHTLTPDEVVALAQAGRRDRPCDGRIRVSRHNEQPGTLAPSDQVVTEGATWMQRS